MDAQPGMRGGSHYDDAELLEQYLIHRNTAVSSPNLVMEAPAFLAEAGPLVDLRILDLGCGDGRFALHCETAGCRSYLGIDGSAAMVERARQHTAPRGDRLSFLHGDIEDLRVEPASVDLACSRMALHYVEHIAPVLAAVSDGLVAGGRVIISVLHPVVSAAHHVGPGPRRSQLVDHYFDPGPRQREWFGRPVTWYHRTIEDYVHGLAEAGLTLTSFSECPPVEDLFDGDEAEFERRRQVPLFLLLGAAKR